MEDFTLMEETTRTHMAKLTGTHRENLCRTPMQDFTRTAMEDLSRSPMKNFTMTPKTQNHGFIETMLCDWSAGDLHQSELVAFFSPALVEITRKTHIMQCFVSHKLSIVLKAHYVTS